MTAHMSLCAPHGGEGVTFSTMPSSAGPSLSPRNARSSSGTRLQPPSTASVTSHFSGADKFSSSRSDQLALKENRCFLLVAKTCTSIRKVVSRGFRKVPGRLVKGMR